MLRKVIPYLTDKYDLIIGLLYLLILDTVHDLDQRFSQSVDFCGSPFVR